MMFEEYLNIYNCRNDNKELIEQLYIKYIKPFDVKNFFNTNEFLDKKEISIKDLGELKEGSCFILDYLNKNNNLNIQKWVFCLNKAEQKELLINMIIKLYTDYSLKSDYNGILNQSYWEISKDWGECSVNCGGGIQIQELKCIIPNEFALPCKGESIRKRECNTHNCVEINVLKKLNITDSDIKSISSIKGNTIEITKLKEPLIEAHPISNHLLRNNECEIKESEGFIVDNKYDNESINIFNKLNKAYIIPIRLEMNLVNLNIYSTKLLFSFNLSDIKVNKKLDNILGECLLIVIKEEKSIKVCNKYEKNFSTNWIQSLYRFTNSCINENKFIDNKIQNIPKDKLDKIKEDIIRNRKLKYLKINNVNEVNQIKKKTLDNQSTAIKALSKQYKIGNLIVNEERIKEQNELDNLYDNILKQRKLKKELIDNINYKNKESMIDTYKNYNIQQEKKIKTELQKDLEKRKEYVKNRILVLRKTFRRKKELLNEKLTEEKLKLAKNIIDSNRLDDTSECFNKDVIKDKNFIKEFCNDYIKKGIFLEQRYDNCISSEFCYNCCEAKIGSSHQKEIDMCYDRC